MRRHDSVYIRHIHDEIEFLEENFQNLTYAELTSDKRAQHMITKALEIIGEASKNLSDATKNEHNTIEWRLIAGMRDRLTHSYDDVSWKTVWDVLQNDIPALKIGIDQILAEKGW
ncbi:DUF86 domain-containing protein [Methanorbis rubei]|uniref:DUF86 domain-containing protein n=1 Tax=Methanorbis rubei TaxID=3028300 RepID=A0AAE4MEN4_9EURY|nr:hypothetical protein [Methanocorpusculaceae archaeon Cs1]